MTKPQDDGGPAFPIPGMSPVGTGDPRDGMAGGCDPQPGMSLRDWFAGMALQGVLASGHFTKPCDNDLNRCFHASTFAQLNKTLADEGRPSETFWWESKKCRSEYLDEPVTSGMTTTDCVESAWRIADAMLAARKEGA